MKGYKNRVYYVLQKCLHSCLNM